MDSRLLRVKWLKFVPEKTLIGEAISGNVLNENGVPVPEFVENPEVLGNGDLEGVGAYLHVTNVEGSYSVDAILNGGTGFVVGEVIRIDGSNFGGVDGVNDLYFEITQIAGPLINQWHELRNEYPWIPLEPGLPVWGLNNDQLQRLITMVYEVGIVKLGLSMTDTFLANDLFQKTHRIRYIGDSEVYRDELDSTNATNLGYGMLPILELVDDFSGYRDWETNQDRKSTRLNSSHLKLSRMPSSA